VLQPDPPVLNWGCRLTEVELCNGNKMVVQFFHGNGCRFLCQ